VGSAQIDASSSQMTSDLMELQPVILESQYAISVADGATTERRICINRGLERYRHQHQVAWRAASGSGSEAVIKK
jgi:hypothetical protein